MLLIACISACVSEHSELGTSWVHQQLTWPGLEYAPSGEPILTERVDPLGELREKLARVGVAVREDCGVELPVCAALGCPSRSLDYYIRVDDTRLSEVLVLGFSEADGSHSRQRLAFIGLRRRPTGSCALSNLWFH